MNSGLFLGRSNGLKLKHINHGAFLFSCEACDVMLNFYKSVLMNKQTHLHLGEYIFSKFSYLDELFL